MTRRLLRVLPLLLLCTTLTHAKLINLHKIPKDHDVIKTFISGTPQESIQGSYINVLVWNMYKGKNRSWEQDFKELTENKNIIIAQEMFLDKKMTNVFENHGDFEYSTATSFYVWGKNRTGVATISDTQVLEKDFLRSKAREPVVKTPKVVMITKHKLDNEQILLVANIHAVNFVASSNLRDQLTQVGNVIKAHKGPVIFGGDFNAWSKKKTKMLKNLMAEFGLSEVKFDPENDDRMRFNKQILDYIFYKDLEVVSSEVRGDIDGADHKPMLATFKLVD